MKLEYIKCHGSGNEFVMIDSTRVDLQGVDLAELSRFVCNRTEAIGADGLLLLCLKEGVYGMRMFNPDGSEAEMCGNGIRCVARLATEVDGTLADEFEMWSGKSTYHISRKACLHADIPTFGVTLAVKEVGEPNRTIPQLDPHLRWRGIDVGNPHIVARVEEIDYNHLQALGERVISLKEIFPQGVNISLVKVVEKKCIFVATYERGAGITPSCGTAMTSSATAMSLNGDCDFGLPIKVCNRGGMVRCICHNEEQLTTQLIGNATYISEGTITLSDKGFSFSVERIFDEEATQYNDFLRALEAL